MDSQNENQSEKKKNNWHKISRKGILIGNFLILVFVLSLLATATLNYIPAPYSYLIVGLEISVTVIAVFTIIRRSTFKPVRPYDFEKLKSQNEPLKLFLTNINYDIGRYEEASSYFFNSVRFYKYSTIVLAGISTVVLGIDLSDFGEVYVFGEMTYTTFAKNIALIIGAIITVSTALMTYWNIEKYWLINKTIVNKLRALRDDTESEFVSKTLDDAKFKEKIVEYKKIKGDFYKYWEGALADRGSQGGQGSNSGAAG